MKSLGEQQTSLYVRVKNYISSRGSSFSLIIALIIISAILTITTRNNIFLSVKNLSNILVNSSIMAVMAAGLTIAMILGGMDISQYAMATVVSMTAATLLEAGMNFILVILIALLIGAACGAVNGFLVSIVKISPIITTIGTMQIFRSIAYLMRDGATIMITNKSYLATGRLYLLDIIPLSIIIMACVFIVTFYVLKYTAFGRKVYSVGGNSQASYLSGINIQLTKFGAFVYSGICAAIAGVMLSALVGAAIPSTGSGSEMTVIAAVILGGISLAGGKGKISGTILGILILSTITNGMTLLNIPSFYQMMINGIVLILAVFIDLLRNGTYRKKS